jgi:hypothetical protein
MLSRHVGENPVSCLKIMPAAIIPQAFLLHYSFFNRIYTYLAVFATFALERNATGYFGKQSIVATNPDIYAGMKVCTSLANQDTACSHYLAIMAFNAKALGCAVTAVPRAAYPFFMGK